MFDFFSNEEEDPEVVQEKAATDLIVFESIAKETYPLAYELFSIFNDEGEEEQEDDDY